MTTSLDKGVATKVASDHRDTADGVNREIGEFFDAVDYLDNVCKGAMLQALLKARDSWVSEANSIVADLREMAGNVDGTVTDFDEQDYANAGQVGKIGVDILKDI